MDTHNMALIVISNLFDGSKATDDQVKTVEQNIRTLNRSLIIENLQNLNLGTSSNLFNNNVKILELLLSGDKTIVENFINLKDRNGNTVLHRIAAQGTNYLMVPYLILAGADPTIEDNNNNPCYVNALNINEFAATIQDGYTQMNDIANKKHVPEKKFFNQIDEISVSNDETLLKEQETDLFYKKINDLARNFVNTPDSTKELILKCRNFNLGENYSPMPGEHYMNDCMNTCCNRSCPFDSFNGVTMHCKQCYLDFWNNYIEFFNTESNRDFVTFREKKRQLVYKTIEHMLKEIENNTYKYETIYKLELSKDEIKYASTKHQWYVEKIIELNINPLKIEMQ